MKSHALTLALVVSMTASGQATAQASPDAATGQPSVHNVLKSADDDEPFDKQFQAARKLALSGKRDEAIVLYSELLQRSPGNADVLLGRGRVYTWKGQWHEAENDLRAAVAASPAYADAWSALGDMYLWSGRATQAVEAYDRWIELSPDEPAPRLARERALGATANPETIGSPAQPLATRAQNPEAVIAEGYHWSAALSAKRTTFNSQRDDWNDYSMSVRRHFEQGSLAVEFFDARRFGLDDLAWALDGYVGLWDRAYANLRYQHGPRGDLFPDRAWRVEIFQGMGRGWELSASHDRLEFDPTDIDIYGFGVGKYAGNFYLLARTLSVSGTGSRNLGYRGLVRYYYAGDGDNYVEVSAGSGRNNDALSRRSITDTGHGSSIGVAFVKYWNPRWGFKIGADYVDTYAERGISATLYRRW